MECKKIDKVMLTEKEHLTVKTHIDGAENKEINWKKIKRAWREDGTLCVEYNNGNWWHYGENGKWW